MARNEGDGSYENLLINIYTKFFRWNFINSDPSSGVISYPISISKASFYSYLAGGIGGRCTFGHFWNSVSRNLYFYNTDFSTKNNNVKGYGFSVRCVAKIGDTTDSICPKGWEMARNDGDGSWVDIITTNYSQISTSGNGDKSIIINPIHLIRSLYYAYDTGKLSGTGFGNYWIKAIHDLTRSNRLNFGDTYISAKSYNFKGYGYSLRCVAKVNLDFFVKVW